MNHYAEQPPIQLMLHRHDAGSEAWWRELSEVEIPRLERLSTGHYRATFFWRDPQGSERTSVTRYVWIDINCVTDHHKMSPESMERLPGTDVWHWSTILASDWRGSYSFIPAADQQRFNPPEGDSRSQRLAQREWWCKTLNRATHDPLNRHSFWHGSRGQSLSGLHLPDAPPQPAWRDFDLGLGRQPPAARLQSYRWHSQRLGNSRTVWIFTTGDAQPDKRPLAILLDGQFWASGMPIWSALMKQTQSGQLPQAVYLLIDAIDSAHRSRELTCNDRFWLALQEELLPQIADMCAYQDEAATTIVAGQSYGGLAALFAGLHWPQRFGCVLSQSGSFWWPRQDLIQATEAADGECWLIEQIKQGLGSRDTLKIFMEAGRRETLIHRVNQRLFEVLRHTHHPLCYREFTGGHDALCWRGGLIDGLTALWSPDFPHWQANSPAGPITPIRQEP
ncbi:MULTISPECIES: enterochelin esterase [unclassified Brenneria]|uniref:enterochelin esterase n=1 Tax=unclassified Brenneria TaxID=2634434 RepID=UPI0018F0A5F5|nr:enterochelin esterase [Brenneria sp. L3-3C-1]MBJ7222351.1 enterochelin esterase [Brenneria sp. L3-3C-1]MEE3643594.1 enterochelin esterase [Brenneria sp. L3_3C_1]